MVARIEKTQQGSLYIPLTAAMAEELRVAEGGSIDLQPVQAARPEIRYATTEETLRAFEETLPQHEAAYRELAK